MRSNLKKNQTESLKDLARFFKEYMPRYGYKYLCTEGDDYKYYQTLGLKLIYRGIFDQNNYGLPIKDLNVWTFDFGVKEEISPLLSLYIADNFYIFANGKTINI